MRHIQQVQVVAKKSLTVIAKEYAEKGLTLKKMALDLELNYGSLKAGLALRKYKHPYGIELVALKIKAESHWEFDEYLQLMIDEELSRNQIASELGIDNKTLQAYADKNNIIFPVSTSRPRNMENIIGALRARVAQRTDLNWLEYKGERLYLTQWAVRTGISGTTLRKRIRLGWSTEEVLTTAVGIKRKSTELTNGRKGRSPVKNHPWRNVDFSSKSCV